MVRKLAPAMALVMMVLSVTALGLGLGDINTRSALNQAFNADLELLSVDPAEIDALRVRLASPEDFERAGVDRPFFLAGLKFTPMLDEAGKPVIRVTSRDPIREPFLNFLVEVNWPKGRLVREYTVLLDPPTTTDRRPPQVQRVDVRPVSPAAPAPMPAAAKSAPAQLPAQYGPVKADETLWGIASKLRPDGASLMQSIMAIYKANPDAFVGGDINRLKRGRILRIPVRDEVLSLTRREASAAYQAAQQHMSAAKTAAEPARAPAEKSAAPAGASEEDAKLRIATARPEGEGTAGAGDDDATGKTTAELNNALMLAREDAESARQESEYLRNRVESMEQQLALLRQRMLNIKDEELAQVQAQLGANAEAPAAEAPSAEAPAAPVAESEPAAQQAEPAEPAPPGLQQRIMDMLGANTALVGGGAAAILALIVLLLLLRRRGAEAAAMPAKPAQDIEAEDLLEESILMDIGSAEGPAAGAHEAAPAGNDTSFLSEFSPSDMNALADDTTEVDPVSEADVYIAYGRYEQAEDLLKQALSREPARMALKFKLLEVYYANRDAAAYTACAQELADAGQDGVDPDAWQHVCEMGRELSPDYPLFTAREAAGSDAAPDFEHSQPMGIDTLSELDVDTELQVPGSAGAEGADSQSPETGPESVLQPADSGSDSAGETELDLTLDLDDLSMPQSVGADDSTLEGLESIDLELPNLDQDPTRKEAVDESPVLDLDSAQGDAGDIDADSLQAQLEELSDLTDLEGELSQLSAEIEGLDMPEEVEDLSAETAAAAGAEEAEIPAPFAGEMAEGDEVQTKLDLATAFVEMGDKEGARSILEEVAAEGNAEQREQAEKLLGDLG